MLPVFLDRNDELGLIELDLQMGVFTLQAGDLLLGRVARMSRPTGTRLVLRCQDTAVALITPFRMSEE